MRMLIGALFCCSIGATAATADGVRDCEQALVQSTYSSMSSDHLNSRLALLVTNDTWDTIKRDAGATATIYGVPVGASYSEYTNNVKRALFGSQSSLTHDQQLNILWTGLDPNANSAYATCINGVLASSVGVHLAVKAATDSDLTLVARYNSGPDDPRTINVSWLGGIKQKDGTSLPGTLRQQNNTVIVIARPTIQQTLAVNSEINGDSVTIDPLPAPWVHKCAQKQGTYNFYGDGCGDGFANEGKVELIKFGNGGSTVIPVNNPNYHAEVGFWLAGDFTGNGLTDLAHLVIGVPGLDPYVHVHFSQGGGQFAPPTAPFVFSKFANPQHDYNAALGTWSVGFDPATNRATLVHDPKLPDGRIYVWRSNGNDGTFTIGVP